MKCKEMKLKDPKYKKRFVNHTAVVGFSSQWRMKEERIEKCSWCCWIKMKEDKQRELFILFTLLKANSCLTSVPFVHHVFKWMKNQSFSLIILLVKGTHDFIPFIWVYFLTITLWREYYTWFFIVTSVVGLYCDSVLCPYISILIGLHLNNSLVCHYFILHYF